jgi:hypothetical protein
MFIQIQFLTLSGRHSQFSKNSADQSPNMKIAPTSKQFRKVETLEYFRKIELLLYT